MAGQAVVREHDGEVVAVLEEAGLDNVVARYVPRRPAFQWVSATPVALPGCDGGSARKTDKLLERLFRHAGYSLDLVDRLELRREPFLRGAEAARAYRPGGGHYLARCSFYHLRVRWKRPMRGPLALGSGRFCGLGVFLADD